jgi:hypothetical protein
MTSRTLTRTLLVLTAATLSMSAIAEAPRAARSEASLGGGSWMLQRYDTNDDGMITLQEFQAGGDALFAQLDADGDGKLSAEELAAAGRGWGRPGWGRRAVQQQDGEQRAERRHDRWFARMDADGDGFISKAEFDDARMARFNALDVNGNSVIEADEIPVRKDGRRGYGKRDRSRSK